MKNKTVISLVVFVLFVPLIVQAIKIENPIGADTLGEVVESLMNFIFWIALALAPLMVLVGAFFLMTSGGNPQKVETGKKIILYTAIGLFIVLFARGIIAILRMALGMS